MKISSHRDLHSNPSQAAEWWLGQGSGWTHLSQFCLGGGSWATTGLWGGLGVMPITVQWSWCVSTAGVCGGSAVGVCMPRWEGLCDQTQDTDFQS